MTGRLDILDDEFTRPKPVGVRLFSVGILRLCRKLRLRFALPADEQRDLTEDEAAREMLVTCYLLDETHSIPYLQAFCVLAPELHAQIIDEYEFAVAPALLQAAQREIARTQRAMEAAAFEVEARPGDPPSALPRGK